jgi:hypothetical protein
MGRWKAESNFQLTDFSFLTRLCLYIEILLHMTMLIVPLIVTSWQLLVMVMLWGKINKWYRKLKGKIRSTYFNCVRIIQTLVPPRFSFASILLWHRRLYRYFVFWVGHLFLLPLANCRYDTKTRLGLIIMYSTPYWVPVIEWRVNAPWIFDFRSRERLLFYTAAFSCLWLGFIFDITIYFQIKEIEEIWYKL